MESKYAGYMGKIMQVDLTTETVKEYPWSDEQRELFLGGKIMAARILYEHLTGKEEAFSEETGSSLQQARSPAPAPQAPRDLIFLPSLRRQVFWLPPTVAAALAFT